MIHHRKPNINFKVSRGLVPIMFMQCTIQFYLVSTIHADSMEQPKDPIDKENVVGPVYKIKCEECEATYIGETERSLKARFGEHRRPSSTTAEVAKHIHTDQPEHTVELDNTEILTTEPRWFEQGVKEVIYIRALNLSLSRDGGRYNLPPVWDNITKKRMKAERPRRGGASSPPSRTTSPNIAGMTDWRS